MAQGWKSYSGPRWALNPTEHPTWKWPFTNGPYLTWQSFRRAAKKNGRKSCRLIVVASKRRVWILCLYFGQGGKTNQIKSCCFSCLDLPSITEKGIIKAEQNHDDGVLTFNQLDPPPFNYSLVGWWGLFSRKLQAEKVSDVLHGALSVSRILIEPKTSLNCVLMEADRWRQTQQLEFLCFIS